MNNTIDSDYKPTASFEDCMVEIRRADESVRANMRRLGELRRADLLESKASNRMNG